MVIAVAGVARPLRQSNLRAGLTALLSADTVP
jgi:hypothetical protein